MKRLSFGNLRIRLIILILVAALPAAGLTLYTFMEHRRETARDIKSNALKLSKLAAATQEQYIEASHQLLTALIQLHREGISSKVSFNTFLSNLIKQYPHYANLGVANSKGDMLYTAIPSSTPINYSDRSWFKQALQTRDFVIGDYVIGRLANKAILPFAQPDVIIGQIQVIVYGAIDLGWFNQLVAKAELPEGAVLTVVDRNGTVLARYPEPEKWFGKNLSDSAIIKTTLTHREGTAEIVGLDGIKRLYAFVPLVGKSEVRAYVSIGIPTTLAYARINRELVRNLIVLSLMALLALVAAWFIGGAFVVQPVNRLLGTTKRLADGDLTTRAGPPYGVGEIGQLAHTFDQMASSLEQREAERKRVEEALRESEETARALVNATTDSVFLIDTAGTILALNEITAKRLGKSVDEMIGSCLYDFLPPDVAKRRKAYLDEVFRTGKPVYFEDERQGIWFDTCGYPIFEAPGKVTKLAIYGRDITERKQAEEALRQSEERFRIAAESSSDFIYEWDTKERVDWFGKIDELLGYAPNEFPRTLEAWANSVHPDDRDRVKAAIKNQLEKNKPYNIEYRVKKKDGTYNYWWARGTTVPDEKGNPLRWIGSVTDVTERKQAEEALRASEQRYRILFEGAAEGILVADIESKQFRYANHAICRMLGYSAEELTRLGVADIHPKEALDHALAEFDAQASREKTLSPEIPCLRKDGSIIYVNIATAPVVIDDRKCNVGFFTDVTERKHAEEAIRQSEERFRELFDDAPVGYYEIDTEGRILRVNKTELEMLGYTLEEMNGQLLWKFVIEEEVTRNNILARLGGTLPPARAIESTCLKKDGTKLPVLLHNRILRDESGRIIGIRSIHQDISEQKKADEEMAVLQEQLRQSQKMEAIGRLAGGIAHDFNNLLTVIKGYSQLSIGELKEGDPLKENIEEVKKAAERAADLTRQLLAFSRRQILETKVLDLNTTFQNLEKMLCRLIGEDIELVFLLGKDLGSVKVDPGQIEQVIMNLAVNARDAMPRGGKLTIETANVELDQEYARAHIAVKPGRYVMLSVSDTGIGMAQEVKERVFEPFFTTKEKGKGTGLGLSTVYGIVKQSEGNIWVYSELGKGTTFKIYLPRVDEPLEELEERVVKGELRYGSETILVVEGDKEVRKLAKRILEKRGYKVLDGSQGNEAIQICEGHKGPINLMVTDVVMPGMDGRELANRLVSVHPEMKVIYMSGYTDNTIVHHGVLEKGMNYIQKPFTVDGLLRKVREVLDR